MKVNPETLNLEREALNAEGIELLNSSIPLILIPSRVSTYGATITSGPVHSRLIFGDARHTNG